MIRAVLWDFGGVILSSPFEAFTHYEQTNGLPDRLHPVRERHRIRTATRGRISSATTSGRPSSTRHSRTSPRRSATASPAPTSSRCSRARCARRWWRRSTRVKAGRLPDGVPHQQRASAATRARDVADVMAGSITSSSRARSACASPSRASTRSPASCSPSSRRVRVPRRPRHQPQAGRGHGHDHDQGRSTPTKPSPTSKSVLGLDLR